MEKRGLSSKRGGNRQGHRLIYVLFVALLGAFFLILGTTRTNATLKYKKQTDKKCTYCHTGIPRPGDEDPQLTKEGKAFKENGYRLSE